jgi:hypothetical protein
VTVIVESAAVRDRRRSPARRRRRQQRVDRARVTDEVDRRLQCDDDLALPRVDRRVMVLVSARMLAIVPVATPPASVTPGCTNVLLLPVDASATLWPATVLPFWSRTVTVIVAVCDAVGDDARVRRGSRRRQGCTEVLRVADEDDGRLLCYDDLGRAPGFTVAVRVFASARMLAMVPSGDAVAVRDAGLRQRVVAAPSTRGSRSGPRRRCRSRRTYRDGRSS